MYINFTLNFSELEAEQKSKYQKYCEIKSNNYKILTKGISHCIIEFNQELQTKINLIAFYIYDLELNYTTNLEK